MGKVERIGIALAAYEPDRAFFLEQLRSIRAQSFQNWVCVISWDSKSDDYRSDADFAELWSDSRFRMLEAAGRLGHKKNFERAIQATLEHGVQAVACADQDDRWYPAKLARLADVLGAKPAMSLVHSDLDLMNEQGRALGTTAWTLERRGVEQVTPLSLLMRNVVTGCSAIFDAELARRYPSIPDEAEFHDHWYALLASVHGGVYPVHEALLAYRQHASNVVGAKKPRALLDISFGKGPRRLLQNARQAWGESLALAEAARKAGAPVPTIGRKDFGLELALQGGLNLRRDPALSRAFLMRSVGKVAAMVASKKS